MVYSYFELIKTGTHEQNEGKETQKTVPAEWWVCKNKVCLHSCTICQCDCICPCVEPSTVHKQTCNRALFMCVQARGCCKSKEDSFKVVSKGTVGLIRHVRLCYGEEAWLKVRLASANSKLREGTCVPMPGW